MAVRRRERRRSGGASSSLSRTATRTRRELKLLAARPQDTNFVFLDPSHPRTVAQRRKYFCRKDSEGFTYDPDTVYAASFHAPFCDLNTLDLSCVPFSLSVPRRLQLEANVELTAPALPRRIGPVKMNIAEHFTKMPIRYTLRSTRLAPRPDGQEGPLEEECFATISFRLVD